MRPMPVNVTTPRERLRSAPDADASCCSSQLLVTSALHSFGLFSLGLGHCCTLIRARCLYSGGGTRSPLACCLSLSLCGLGSNGESNDEHGCQEAHWFTR
jgi:hypothetical protein